MEKDGSFLLSIFSAGYAGIGLRQSPSSTISSIHRQVELLLSDLSVARNEATPKSRLQRLYSIVSTVIVDQLSNLRGQGPTPPTGIWSIGPRIGKKYAGSLYLFNHRRDDSDLVAPRFNNFKICGTCRFTVALFQYFVVRRTPV